MSVVIKEIIVKTTVEREKRQEREEAVIPQEMLDRLKEEILREMAWQEQFEPRRKER